MATPGPAQRVPANIIRISFPQIGGLVYLRASMRTEADPTPISPVALVKGLPWDEFDLFDVVGGVVDPEASDDLKAETVPIEDPVTDKMLQKYLYWAHRAVVTDRRTIVVPGFEIVVVDLAQWTLVYNHVIGFALSPIMSREAALAQFQSLAGSTGYESADPALMAVTLTNTLGVPFATTSELIAFANAAGWTYHTETSGSTSVYNEDDVASVIINLAKLFRDVPNDPTTDAKPAEVEFTVDLPRFTLGGGHGGIQFWLTGSAWNPKPPKDPPDPSQPEWERTTFPVTERVVPISGIPGAFNTDHNWPTFPHPFNSIDAEAKDLSVPSSQEVVAGTITFGAGNEPPFIELELDDGGGGEG